MEWIRKLLAEHTDENGAVDTETFITAVNKEFPKQAVIKTKYNEKAKEADDARRELQELQENAPDLEAVQKELAAVKQELVQTKTGSQVETALRKAGAADEDIDYLRFRLGEIELDENGQVKDLDTKVADLSKQYSKFFTAAAETKRETGTQQQQLPPGYSVQDNSLDKGKQPDPLALQMAELEKVLGLTPQNVGEPAE